MKGMILPRASFNKTYDNFYSEPTPKNSSSTQNYESLLNYNLQNGNAALYKKYTQFMDNQNNIITSTLAQQDKNTISSQIKPDRFLVQDIRASKQNRKPKNSIELNKIEEDVVNKIRDTSNQFIKDLLKELAEVYSKMRTIKLDSQQKIHKLQAQLSNQKDTIKQLARQYHFQFQHKSTQHNLHNQSPKKQIQNTIQSYQKKLKNLLAEIQKLQIKNNQLYGEKLQLNNQLTQLNRVLRMQRESSNQKSKQYKGMEMLVKQYQSAVEQYERQLEVKRNVMNDMLNKLEKVECCNKDRMVQLDACNKEIKNQKDEIQKLKKMLQNQKNINKEYQRQIEDLKQSIIQQQKLSQNNLKTYKNTETNLNLQLEASILKSNKASQKIAQLQKLLAQSQSQVSCVRQQTKKTLQKLQVMFKSSKSLNLCQKLLNFQKATLIVQDKL